MDLQGHLQLTCRHPCRPSCEARDAGTLLRISVGSLGFVEGLGIRVGISVWRLGFVESLGIKVRISVWSFGFLLRV